LQASQKTNPASQFTVQQTPLTTTPVVSNIPVQTIVRNPAPSANTVASQNGLAKMATTFDESKLPINWGKNCLQFDGQQPEELRKFLTSLETIFVTSKASTDAEKKLVALRYCSGATKDEWESMVTARDPYSWEDFKEEIVQSYPEAKELEHGSVARLEEYVRKHVNRPIQADDVSAYQAFLRGFRTRVSKLLEPKVRITNREAAKLFMRPLDPVFQQGIRSVMRTTPAEALPSYKAGKTIWEADTANKGVPYVHESRDDDDKYVWTDMVAAATRIVDEESSSFYEAAPSSTRFDKKRTVLIQGIEAPAESSVLKQLAEKLNSIESNMEKTMAQHMDKMTAAQHKEMVELKVTMDTLKSGRPSSTSTQSSSSGPRNFTSRNCFYCFEDGHFMSDCRKRHEDIDKGIVKVVDGKTQCFDGKTIPREPKHICAMDKAREYHERRHVSQNYDELMDHYFGEEPSAEYDSKPDEIRTLKAEIALLQRQQPDPGPRSNPRKALLQEESGDKARLDSALKAMERMSLLLGVEQLVQTRTGRGAASSQEEDF
jgi:hypothetical protein